MKPTDLINILSGRFKVIHAGIGIITWSVSKKYLICLNYQGNDSYQIKFFKNPAFKKNIFYTLYGGLPHQNKDLINLSDILSDLDKKDQDFFIFHIDIFSKEFHVSDEPHDIEF